MPRESIVGQHLCLWYPVRSTQRRCGLEMQREFVQHVEGLHLHATFI